MLSRIKDILRFAIEGARFTYLRRNVFTANSIHEIKKIFNWTEEGILARDDIYTFDYIEDLNERRLRDAEVLATVFKNCNAKIALEIGTSTGRGTSLIAANAKNTKIYTVNIPPEEILNGEGGVLTTIALEKEKIGFEYREKGFTNIEQIFANTKTWEPNIGTIDVAFIDGCHDTEFVINDTIKVIKHMKPGSIILWHDFNPDLIQKHGWIRDVCLGIEALYKKKILTNKIYHLKDSWIGIYQV